MSQKTTTPQSQKELPSKIKAYLCANAELIFSIQSHPDFRVKFHKIMDQIHAAQDGGQDFQMIEAEQAFFRFLAKAQILLNLGINRCDAIRFFIH